MATGPEVVNENVLEAVCGTHSVEVLGSLRLMNEGGAARTRARGSSG